MMKEIYAGEAFSSLGDYEEARAALIANEKALAFDGRAIAAASALEKRANELIEAIRKSDEVDVYGTMRYRHGRQAAAVDHFLGNGDLIDTIELIKVAGKMPKGAHLHCHFNSSLRPEILLEQSRGRESMYIRSTIPLTNAEAMLKAEISFLAQDPQPEGVSIFSQDYVPQTWTRYTKFCKEFQGGIEGAEHWLLTKMLPNEEIVYNTYQTSTEIWERFNVGTGKLKSLFNYESAFKASSRACINDFIDGNIHFKGLALRGTSPYKSLHSTDETPSSNLSFSRSKDNVLNPRNKSLPTYSKKKRGVPGFANGLRKSAIADTGSAENVISAACASNMKLAINRLPQVFQLGNSTRVESIGTTTIRWAFAEDPTKVYNLQFHVIPDLIYDMILGRAFLTATETLTKYTRRIKECVFSVANYFGFNLLGETHPRLEGVLDGTIQALAVPDTGAERNVIDAQYARLLGLKMDTGPGTRNTLQFADGTYKETIGQVHTSWTFANGESVPITFEVLDDCATNLVVGEDFIFEHNIFEDHAASLQSLDSDIDAWELFPFDFMSSWQRQCLTLGEKLWRSDRPDKLSPPSPTQIEHQRRDQWNHQYEFGATATVAEQQAEQKRRSEYEGARTRFMQALQLPPQQNTNCSHRIPSIPTAPGRPLDSRVVGSGPGARMQKAWRQVRGRRRNLVMNEGRVEL